MTNRIAVLLLCTLLLDACASTPGPKNGAPAKPANVKEWIAQSRARKSAIVGGIVGGLGSGIVAKLAGMSDEEAARRMVAGAVAGAMAGYAIGKRQDRIFAGRDLAVRQAGYDKSQGYIARVERVTFDPPNPKPGQTAQLYVRYLVLGPNPNEDIKVQMFRGLKYGDNYVFGAGPNEFVIPKGGAVVESTVEVRLSKKAPTGTYSIEALIEDPESRFPQAAGTGEVYIVAQARQHGGTVTAAR